MALPREYQETPVDSPDHIERSHVQGEDVNACPARNARAMRSIASGNPTETTNRTIRICQRKRVGEREGGYGRLPRDGETNHRKDGGTEGRIAAPPRASDERETPRRAGVSIRR